MMLKFWLPIRPPICSDGGRRTNPRKPGKRRSCGQIFCAICCALVARRARRQLHHQVAAVGAAASSARTAAAGAAADAGLERINVRVLDDDVGDLLHPLRHVVVRSSLRRLQVDEQRIVVLIGNEPGRDDVRHPHGGAEHGDEDQQHRDPMAQHVAERPGVRSQQPVECPIHQAGKAPLAVNDAEEPAAQHRRQCDGDDT
jgi:hypothetical protein